MTPYLFLISLGIAAEKITLLRSTGELYVDREGLTPEQCERLAGNPRVSSDELGFWLASVDRKAVPAR
jgi:hypothetical protein